MSGTTKLVLYILGFVVLGWAAVKIIEMLIGMVTIALAFAIPIVVVGVIIYAVFALSRKSLGGGRRTLP